MKKFLSILICAALVFSLFIPFSVFAAPNGEPAKAVQTVIKGNTVQQVKGDNDPPYAKDRVIVKLRTANLMARSAFSSTKTLAPSVLPNLGVNAKETRLINPSQTTGITPRSASGPTQNNTFVLTLKDSGVEAVQDALKTLNANPSVEYAVPDLFGDFPK